MTREEKIEKIAEVLLSRMDLKSLEQFYYDITILDFEKVEDEDVDIEYIDVVGGNKND